MQVFLLFLLVFFIVFLPAFLLWWHAPLLHSVLLPAYYIPLNILILFDAVALANKQACLFCSRLLRIFVKLYLPGREKVVG